MPTRMGAESSRGGIPSQSAPEQRTEPELQADVGARVRDDRRRQSVPPEEISPEAAGRHVYGDLTDAENGREWAARGGELEVKQHVDDRDGDDREPKRGRASLARPEAPRKERHQPQAVDVLIDDDERHEDGDALPCRYQRDARGPP